MKGDEKEREGRTGTMITTGDWPERETADALQGRETASWRKRCPFWTVTGSVVPVKDS